VTVALLIFDLDGTLVPTMEDYADQAAMLMEAHFGTPRGAARGDYFRTSGLPFQKQLRLLYPERDAGETDAVAARFERWKDGYLRSIALPPQITTLLQYWRECGYRIAISSNNMQTYVDRLARDWPIDCALGFRPEDNFAKGEAHFRTLEARFGLARAQLLFTGDSPNDARIARAAGVAFRALLTRAFRHEDFRAIDPHVVVLESLHELTASLPACAVARGDVTQG
jgi:phosphoglycolate phosphatase-like HAD superfamily hydrolase